MYICKKFLIYRYIWVPNSLNEKLSAVEYFSIFLFALKCFDKLGNSVTLGQACFSSNIYLSVVLMKINDVSKVFNKQYQYYRKKLHVTNL